MKLKQKITLKFLISTAVPFALGTIVMLLFNRNVVHRAMETISVNYVKTQSLVLESFFLIG